MNGGTPRWDSTSYILADLIEVIIKRPYLNRPENAPLRERVEEQQRAKARAEAKVSARFASRTAQLALERG